MELGRAWPPSREAWSPIGRVTDTDEYEEDALHNPFSEIIKADDLSARRARELFVPEASPIWSRVQNPLNQLIVGPRGAGKTIALRQLDHRIQTAPKEELSYIGIYIQISRISTTFQSLFEEAEQRQDVVSKRLFQKVFSDNVWMEIVGEIARYIQSCSGTASAVRLDEIQRVFGISANSADELETRCIEIQADIESRIQAWSVTSDYSWTPIADLPASMRRCAVGLRRLFPWLRKEQPCLYLLLDESSPIPVPCQHVLNGLLHRGRDYCVKLAVRPYEWESLVTTTNRNIELDTDLWPLRIDYPKETGESYIEDMTQVINRVLRARMEACGFDEGENTPDIQRILQSGSQQKYSGIRAICAASSGNPQNLLQICSNLFSMEPTEDSNGRTVFHYRQQDAAVRSWSREYEDRNPDGVSRSFCRALLRQVKHAKANDRTIGFRFLAADIPDLFTDEYIPIEVGRKIRSGFSAGFLRSTLISNTSLFEIPAEFHLSRGLLPRAELRLDLPVGPPTEIDKEFVGKNARESRPIRGLPIVDREREISAFLSTSFSPMLQQQRIDIKKKLQRAGIVCKDINDIPGDQFLFTTIRSLIRNSDITVLDATQLRPFTMFEVGLCAGDRKPKSVICVVHDDGSGDPIAELPDAVRKLPILSYSMKASELERLAVEVASRARELLDKPSEFSRVALTSTTLRGRRRTNCVYVSLPETDYRDAALDAIQTRLEDTGWTMITEEDMGTFVVNELQVSIQCAYVARVGVIDTTGVGLPDLLQSYRLGLFAGKRRPWRVMRTERAEHANKQVFSSVPLARYETWSTYEQLAEHIATFVVS